MTRIRTALLPLACALLLATTAGLAAEPAKTYEIVVAKRSEPALHVPMRKLIEVPDDLRNAAVVVRSADGSQVLPGQLSAPSLLSEGTGRQLTFVVPKIGTESDQKFVAELYPPSQAPEIVREVPRYRWEVTEPEKITTLFYGLKPTLQYMYEALDESSPERREQTYKVYHHVYSPDGEQLLTKGPGGKFTHHRGLFYGFMKVSYDDGNKKCDTWHCRGDAYLSHQGIESTEAGPVFGRHVVKIHWHGPGKEHFATELRELTAYATEGGTLIEFASKLMSEVGEITLDGDPQHAGFQFRASNEVADKTAKQTYYLRPDGKGAPGQTRNWPGNKEHANLPWNAMSFVVGGDRYTALYLDRPENPKEARYSERDYGRFGSYFVTKLDNDNPLAVNYRVWIQDGELTQDTAEAIHNAFVK